MPERNVFSDVELKRRRQHFRTLPGTRQVAHIQHARKLMGERSVAICNGLLVREVRALEKGTIPSSLQPKHTQSAQVTTPAPSGSPPGRRG